MKTARLALSTARDVLIAVKGATLSVMGRDLDDTRRLIVDEGGLAAYRASREVRSVDEANRRRVLAESGLVHPNLAAVRAPLFCSGTGFFLAADKVQVKYEMLRSHLVDAQPVTEAAAAHGYSRAAFYLVSASFEQLGMAGLLDERRGRRGPVKLHPEIVEFIRAQAHGSGADVADQVAQRFGVRLHRRTVERARVR
jgi:transposase